MPTKRGWITIGLAIIIFLIGLKTQRVILLSTSLIMVSMLSAIWITYYRPLWRIKLRYASPLRIKEDGDLTIKINIINQGWWTVKSIEYLDAFPMLDEKEQRKHQYFIDKIKRHSDKTITIESKAYLRGRHNLGPAQLITRDPFGFFFSKQLFTEKASTMVTPTYFPIEHLPIFRQRTLHRTSTVPVSSSGESNEFFAIRGYNPQDGLKRIHWRSSAKLNTLMVKEFESMPAYQVTCLLDPRSLANIGPGRETPMEYQIKIAHSLIRCLLPQQNYCQIITFNGRELDFSEHGNTNVHYETILQKLTDTSASYPHNFSNWLHEAGRFVGSGSTVFLFIAKWDDSLLPSLLQIQSNDIQLRPILFDHESFEFPDVQSDGIESAVKLLTRHGLDPIEIEHDQDFTELWTSKDMIRRLDKVS